MQYVQGMTVVNLALNLPGPAAARRLFLMGAEVVKVEPPGGDPLLGYCAAWYRELASGQEAFRLDLRERADRARFEALLERADLLLTSNRPKALARLGLCWEELHARFPRLCQVAIFGHPAPRADVAGHDLTCQAPLGLVEPPRLPRLLLADLACAERTVSAALGALLVRERTGQAVHAEVTLSESAGSLADMLRFGLTEPGGLLGGGAPEYGVYRAADGFVALAALEPRFKRNLETCLGHALETPERYRSAFLTKTVEEWLRAGEAHDFPIAAVAGAGE